MSNLKKKSEFGVSFGDTHLHVDAPIKEDAELGLQQLGAYVRVLNHDFQLELAQQERTKRRIMIVIILVALVCAGLGFLFDEVRLGIAQYQPLTIVSAAATVRADIIQFDIEPTPIPGQK